MIETFVLGPIPGGVELMHYNHADDSITLEQKWDAEPVTELNKARSNAVAGNWRGDMHLVASIPMPLYMELQKKGITQDPKRFSEWLNERDNQLFRTKRGII